MKAAEKVPLVAGRDYPRTYREFVETFRDDAACAAYLAQLRWRGGFVCSGCGAVGPPWHQTRGRLVCSSCRRQSSVTAGTILDKTRTPLTTWFEAAWHATTAKSGVSAKTLERTLGVRYRVAWAMLHRLRVAMVRSERDRLSGAVEMDETWIGGVDQSGRHGRVPNKSLVVIAIEILEPKGFGRVRMRRVPDATAETLLRFTREVVEPGSTIHTDGWTGYLQLPRHGYEHQRTSLQYSKDPAHVSLPGVHRIASLLKRWILGTHQGSVDPDHLQSYLEEFSFRFNRRNSRSRGLVFRRLLEQAVVTGPITEAEIRHGYAW